MFSVQNTVDKLDRAMRRKAQSAPGDDADAAAGLLTPSTSNNMPSSSSSMNLAANTLGHPSALPTPPTTRGADLEFFEDLVSEPVLVLGVDISHLSRQAQYLMCAAGLFGFSLLYGYLQELLSVHLCNRQLGLFLATVQFCGYTILSYILRTYVYQKQQNAFLASNVKRSSSSESLMSVASGSTTQPSKTPSPPSGLRSKIEVPLYLYLGLSLLRAVDLGMTNLAMQFINYPAKTLMKSSRVVFTMIFGVILAKKRYYCVDYAIVLCIVGGLAIFMHADANSSAVFEANGVIMLTISLLCDGAITTMSETIMNQYGVGQDEFIFRMYSIALVAIGSAAAIKGDMVDGMAWLMTPGTYSEQLENIPMDQRTWSVMGKCTVIVLFSTMGFFGSSCSAAITKNFGALSMSITSTARKATTLFLSFLLFDNECTVEHIIGIVVFIAALTAKSLRRKGKSKSSKRSSSSSSIRRDVELGRPRALSRQSSLIENGSPPSLPPPMPGQYKRGVSDGRLISESSSTSLGRGHYHVV